MLVYLSCFFMLWTINNARRCFSGYRNTVISANPPSAAQTEVISVCVPAGFLVVLGPVFRGCEEPIGACSSMENRAPCFDIFRDAQGLKAKLLINLYVEGKAKQPPPNAPGGFFHLCYEGKQQ